MNRYRALLIAETANPEWVSVPLEGWSHSRAIAECTDAHLVTQVRNRDAILRAGLVEGRDFTVIDTESVAGPLCRLAKMLRGGDGRGWTLVQATVAFAHHYFEQCVWRVFGRRIRSGEFDVVHRLTPVSPTAPSPIATRCRRAGVPFVLGPLNGGVPWPRAFDGARRQENEWLSYIRGAYRLVPGTRSMLRDAAAILIGSRDTLPQVPAQHRHKCIYVAENAVDPTRFSMRRRRWVDTPLRVVFAGRLVPYKGPDMALEAAAPLIREGAMTFDVIGDGPLRTNLETIIAREGIGRGARCLGWIEHQQLQQHLVDADLFLFPSIREFGGGAVLEAMALGVVPIVVDYGGPGELVTPSTGYLVPLGDRASIVRDIRGLLDRLCDDPSGVQSRSSAAVRRVHRYFTWTRKANQVLEVYRWVLGQRRSKPDFGMPYPDPVNGVHHTEEWAHQAYPMCVEAGD